MNKIKIYFFLVFLQLSSDAKHIHVLTLLHAFRSSIQLHISYNTQSDPETLGK